MTTQDSRATKANLAVLVGVMAIVTLVITILLMRQGDAPEAPAQNPFTGLTAETDKPASLVPEFQRPGESHMPGVDGPGQAPAVVVGKGLEKLVGVGDVPVTSGSKPPLRPGGRKKLAEAEQTERDMAFLNKHSQLIAVEDRRLRAISRKYHKKYKIVDEVSRYFGALPNYMALLKKYRETNPFALMRRSVALPEVRAGVKKFAARPEAMSVGVMMVAEAISGKPPKPIVDEAMRFLNEDDAVGEFMHTDFWPQVLPRLPAAIIETPMTPETRKTMQEMAGTLTGAPMAGAPNLTGQPGRPR
jgi:hypothetical protein